MYKFATNATVAVSLLLSASGVAPVWAETTHDRKCSSAKHKHAKRPAAEPKARPGSGAMLVEKQKFDVQILSFGP